MQSGSANLILIVKDIAVQEAEGRVLGLSTRLGDDDGKLLELGQDLEEENRQLRARVDELEPGEEKQ